MGDEAEHPLALLSLHRLIFLFLALGVIRNFLFGLNDQKYCFLDVSCLTSKQTDSLETIINNYRGL